MNSHYYAEATTADTREGRAAHVGLRKKARPNRRTVQMPELMATLIADVKYQHRLREDFCRRRIHPSIEATVGHMYSAVQSSM